MSLIYRVAIILAIALQVEAKPAMKTFTERNLWVAKAHTSAADWLRLIVVLKAKGSRVEVTCLSEKKETVVNLTLEDAEDFAAQLPAWLQAGASNEQVGYIATFGAVNDKAHEVRVNLDDQRFVIFKKKIIRYLEDHS